MINIVIAENEKKVRRLLAGLLKNEGYNVALSESADYNLISIPSPKEIDSQKPLSDVIVELEKSLYNEKKGVLYKTILERVEKPLIEYALERAEGNQLKAAKALGINRNTIRSKIKRLSIDPMRWKP